LAIDRGNSFRRFFHSLYYTLRIHPGGQPGLGMPVLSAATLPVSQSALLCPSTQEFYPGNFLTYL
jgi:hypothetical protein